MRTLVGELNALLQALGLASKDIISSPTDLKPRLLLKILGALLPSLSYAPLPVGDDVQAMKVFLGVLETDVLRSGDSDCDISVCYVDPRKLAKGGKDECEYVGKVLVWLGRQLGLDLPDETESTHGEEEDVLAGLDDPLEYEENEQDDPSRCIHDLSFASYRSPSRHQSGYHDEAPADDESSILQSPRQSPSVRYHGWIDFADEGKEIEEYELRRSRGHDSQFSALSISDSVTADSIDSNAFFAPDPVIEEPTTPPSPSPIRPYPERRLRKPHVSSAYLLGENFDILRTPEKPATLRNRASTSSSSSPRLSFQDQGSPRTHPTPSSRHRLRSPSPTLETNASSPGSYARTLALLNRRATLLEEIARHQRQKSTMGT